MRTLIGAAEPEPQVPRVSFTATPGTTSSTAIVWWLTPTETQPPQREPYRTTAYVGRPIPELEQGGIA